MAYIKIILNNFLKKTKTFESSKIPLSVHFVSDLYAAFALVQSDTQHMVEEDVEQGWCDDAALSDTLVDVEVVRLLSVSAHSRTSSGVEVSDQSLELLRDADVLKHAPQSESIDGVVGLAEIDEARVGRPVEFA